MSIEQNIEDVRRRIELAAERAGRSPQEITLVAVTKTLPPSAVEAAFRAGVRHFGENRVQEAEQKICRLASLAPRPTWHLVGHLQSNKAKTAVDIFDIIQSVDSVRLAETLSRHAKKTLPILLEVNVSGEASKYGFQTSDLATALKQITGLPNLRVEGLMTVAPAVSDPERVRPVFRRLREFAHDVGLKHLSMGMSDDFEVAIEEGATMVRIGRAIFGERML